MRAPASRARIIAKVNSLIDPAIIDELYLASQAGVKIDLIVRGMCSLRPGVPGVSENIRALSIIDRYLEHARVFYFHNGGEPNYWLASADWMERNFDHRVEIAFPILEPHHRDRLKEILEVQLNDHVKGWWLQPDGKWERWAPDGATAMRSQERLYELTQNNFHWNKPAASAIGRVKEPTHGLSVGPKTKNRGLLKEAPV